MPVLLFVEKMKGYSSHFLCIVRKYFLSLDKAVEREYLRDEGLFCFPRGPQT